MKTYIQNIKHYASALKKAAVWHESGAILAPVVGKDAVEDNYVYEFYCYIRIIADLLKHYKISFIKGSGKYAYKFPQAAAKKGGKPRFHAFDKADKLIFQICAGTMIEGRFNSEKNHPDISFQLSTANDNPRESDLIIIMDAKYKEGKNVNLPKGEIYKFSTIVDLFNLRDKPKLKIKFDELIGIEGNCLITNGKSYSKATDTLFLKEYYMKEVEEFCPNKKHNILS